MRKTTLAGYLLLACLCAAPMASAQDPPDAQAAPKQPAGIPHFYRVTFVVQEVNAEGKPINSRSYNTILSTQARQVSIRNTSRVPIATEPPANGLTSQFTYSNLGVDIDVQQVVEVGHGLAMNITSTVDRLATANDPSLHTPITRHNTWNSPVIVPIGKPTAVFSSDDLDGKGSLQMVVTATPIP